ncbi:hypothetical protein ACFOEP_00030 [Microbacterium amylolyticum]|uniref:hypothetical protein n=1 Tax=Microbacterium amylolyticum TaxID=936337 RepID=UPI003607A2ED
MSEIEQVPHGVGASAILVGVDNNAGVGSFGVHVHNGDARRKHLGRVGQHRRLQIEDQGVDGELLHAGEQAVDVCLAVSRDVHGTSVVA